MKWRVAALVSTALIGSLAIVWVSRSTWERVDQLQGEFARLKAESFYRGVRMRGDIQRLNDTLLRYRLRGDAADAEAFRAGAQEFRQWLERNRNQTVSTLERQFFQQVATAYDDYLVDGMKLLEASRTRWLTTKGTIFRDSYERVQQQSQFLLGLCDAFIERQRSSFDDFLKESNRTLTRFQRLLQLSLALLLILAAVLVALAYRGMIAPLRHQLTESQATIARQEKLASLGVLAAGVAHEIRNPLTAIKFRLFSLRKVLPPGDAESEDAAVIDSEINRLERIVKDFLQFARPSEPELVVIPVPRLLQEVSGLLRPQFDRSGIELHLENSEPAWIRADTQQIKQVLINLLQNAADSAGRGGVITLRSRHDPRSSRNGDTGNVALEVEDNGKGIPLEVQKRLFDPFFTTKRGGSGLGLPIAARIVEKHGGELRYQTELHRGTTFRVVLPRVAEHET